MEEVICGYCPCIFFSLTIDNGTRTGRGYSWVLSLQIFVIDHELWLEEVICWYCPCKFLSLTMELWLEEIICATNFYCNKFLKYMYKELVPIENLGRWIGPRRRNGPVSECPLSASAIFFIFPKLHFAINLDKDNSVNRRIQTRFKAARLKRSERLWVATDEFQYS